MMRTIKIKSVIMTIALLTSTQVFSGGSVSFDKPKIWKVGQTTTGTWSVYEDWKIVDDPTSEHLGDANIPKAAGPASGNFKAKAEEYTKNRDEAVIYLILKNTKTGETEDESNSPKDTCTIVGIEGRMTGKSWLDHRGEQ